MNAMNTNDNAMLLWIGIILVIILFVLFILAIRSQNEGAIEDMDTDDQAGALTDDDVNHITLNVFSKRKPKVVKNDDRDWHGGVRSNSEGVSNNWKNK